MKLLRTILIALSILANSRAQAQNALSPIDAIAQRLIESLEASGKLPRDLKYAAVTADRESARDEHAASMVAAVEQLATGRLGLELTPDTQLLVEFVASYYKTSGFEEFLHDDPKLLGGQFKDVTCVFWLAIRTADLTEQGAPSCKRLDVSARLFDLRSMTAPWVATQSSLVVDSGRWSAWTTAIQSAANADSLSELRSQTQYLRSQRALLAPADSGHFDALERALAERSSSFERAAQASDTERDSRRALNSAGLAIGALALAALMVAIVVRQRRGASRARAELVTRREDQSRAESDRGEVSRALGLVSDASARDRQWRDSLLRRLARARESLATAPDAARALDALSDHVRRLEDGDPVRSAKGDPTRALALATRCAARSEAVAALGEELERQAALLGALAEPGADRPRQLELFTRMLERARAMLDARAEALNGAEPLS